MSQSLIKQPSPLSQLLTFFSNYWNLCGALHRRNDLEQLIDWADRKRLTNVSRAYKIYLGDVENKLLRLRCRSPLTARLAEIAVLLNNSIRSKTYRSGYASQYSRRSYIKLGA